MTDGTMTDQKEDGQVAYKAWCAALGITPLTSPTYDAKRAWAAVESACRAIDAPELERLRARVAELETSVAESEAMLKAALMREAVAANRKKLGLK